MLASPAFKMALIQLGQDAEVRRGGAVVFRAKTMVRKEEPCVEFSPEIEVQAGDEVSLILSKKTHLIDRVEPYVMGTEVVKLKAFYQVAPHIDRPHMVVHGSVINAGNILNSALQIHSPHATQTVTFGIDQKESAKEAIRLVLEVIDELDLTPDDKEEVKADAESVKAQTNSPKTKWQQVKEFLAAIRDKVKAGLTERVAAVALSKGDAAYKAIESTINQMGS